MQFIDDRADVDHDEEEGPDYDDPDSMEALVRAADQRDFPMDEFEAGHQARLESAAPYRLPESQHTPQTPLFLPDPQNDRTTPMFFPERVSMTPLPAALPNVPGRLLTPFALTQDNVSVRFFSGDIHLLNCVQFLRGDSSQAESETSSLTASKREHGSDDNASSPPKRRRIEKRSIAEFFDTAAEESDEEGDCEEEEEDEETLSDQGA